MAVTATFAADFSSFQEAVAQADVSLKNIDDGAAKVGTSLTKMSNSLSGTSIIQQATLMAQAVQNVGGVSALTEAELAKVGAVAQEAAAKLTALGQDVPPGIQNIADAAKNVNTQHVNLLSTLSQVAAAFGVAWSVQGAVSFIQTIVDEAQTLRNLSLQTRINVEDLQVLTDATKEYGIEGDQLGRALFQLQQRIAGGDQSVATAYHLMGLSIDDVREKDPIDLFLTTERGLGSLSGAIQDTAAQDLFGGRLGSSLIAFSKGADDAIAKSRDLNKVASTESVEAAAAYADAIGRATASVHAWFTELVGGLQHLSDGDQILNTATAKAGTLAVLWAQIQDLATSSFSGGANVSHLTDLLDGLNQKATATVAAESALAAQARDLAAAGGPLNSGLTVQLGIHQQIAAAMTAQQQAAKFMASVEIDSAKPLLDFQEADLDQLNAIGQLTAKNAAALGVNIDQFDAYKKKLEDIKTSTEELQKASDKTWEGMLAKQKLEEDEILVVTKLWDQYTEAINDSSSSTFDKAGAAIDKWVADTIAANQKAKTDTLAFYLAVGAVQDAQWQKLTANTLASTQGTHEYFIKLASDAQAAYDFATAHSTSYGNAQIASLRAAAEAAKDAANQWSASFDPVIAKTTSDIAGVTAAVVGLSSAERAASSVGGISNSDEASAEQAAVSGNGTDPLVAALVASGYSINEALAIASGGGALIGGPKGNSLTGKRASGGPVSSGGTYLVGENGPELFSPQSSGVISPNGGGGPMVTNHIYVNGTAADVARQVADQIMKTLMRSQKL